VKRLARKPDKRRAFTIVELLTVMSVIILLISLLVPSLNKIRRYALYVKQRNQFKGIGDGLTLFNAEWEDYPDSKREDDCKRQLYCGAMRLCEAMVGQDLLGFHSLSRFCQMGTIDGENPIPNTPLSAGGNDLYPARQLPAPRPQTALISQSESERKGLYISREQANAYKMGDLYNPALVNSTDGFKSADASASSLPVICDVYSTAMHAQTGKTVGSPVLYYKANTTKHLHDPGGDPRNNIYNWQDNMDLINLGVAMQPGFYHPMGSKDRQTPIEGVIENYRIFYDMTRNQQLSVPKPYNDDSFILISAGFDGLYGTTDDVFNFEK
jgi:type II secretory pathway pseudopilin PulG